MSKPVINLIQSANDDSLFIVDSLVNTLDPKPGAVLTEKQVEELMHNARRGKQTVKINRARGA